MQILQDDSSPYCDKCQSLQPATKRQLICRPFSHYMVIHLKRFSPNGQKIHRYVRVDEYLKLICNNNGDNGCNSGGDVHQIHHYILHSLVIHLGTEWSGHYATLFREVNGSWTLLDDQRICRNVPTQSTHRMLHYHAYLCIYKHVKMNQVKTK